MDWRAHLGGLVTGAAVAAVMVFPSRRHRLVVQVTGLLLIVAVLVAITAWRTAQINELYCKFLCHNICVLISSIYELGLAPEFWQDREVA